MSFNYLCATGSGEAARVHPYIGWLTPGLRTVMCPAVAVVLAVRPSLLCQADLTLLCQADQPYYVKPTDLTMSG
ncbi:hypothetical protein [Bacteroides helcogenes]|uniref:hypothetical protein n=1 Tax=Bacteroides helcogenes TaxID=290053 RepID=UPI0002F88787|nr:hypothetical protein [Bacteroides helcogenes]MDY5238656.1 hypothetical protein [Bacteroides helcogenes]